MLLQVDPLNIAGNGMDLPPGVVVKVYNLVDSTEAINNVNVREFTLICTSCARSTARSKRVLPTRLRALVG